MSSLPHADDTPPPPSAMALADGCPECVLNVEPPNTAVRVDGAWRAAYVCSDCRHQWTTDWRA